MVTRGSASSLLTQPDAWLARLNHDLVKRLLWPARDRHELGGAPAPSELMVQVTNDEGLQVQASELWQCFRDEAPAAIPAGALDDFGAALERAVAAGAAGDVGGVLKLGDAYAQLARIVKQSAAGA